MTGARGDEFCPISRDTDRVRAARRRAAVDREIGLRASGKPCPGCREFTWLVPGGRGCRCGTSPGVLAAKCNRLAVLAADAMKCQTGDRRERPAT